MSRAPLFDTPFTRITEHWFTAQGHKACNIFEQDFYRCASQVGMRKSGKVCAKEYDDFLECMKKTKQRERYDALQKIRREKGAGYEEPPIQDSYIPNQARA